MAERLKAALVGVGSMGRGHLDNYVKLLKEDSDIEIVALCDIDEKKFTNYKADFNLGPVGEDGYDFDKFRLYTDLDEMLEKETALDMVTVALPTYLHAWGTIKCLNKGINVLCEKPMAPTYEDCMAMIEAAEKNGKFLTRIETCYSSPELVYADIGGSVGDEYTITAYDAAGNASAAVTAK